MTIRTCAEVVAFFLSVIIVSCTFTVDQKYYKPVPPPLAINLVVDIESPQLKDPYFLDWPTDFVLDVQKTGKPLSHFTVQVNNSMENIGVYINGVFKFSLNPVTLGQGTHQIKIHLYFDTQTGSLADVLDMEHYHVEKNITVVVDTSLPVVSAIVQPKIENGYLTFRWDFNSQHQFKYHMSRTLGTSSTTMANIEGDDFTGTGQMVYIDSGYVGGWAAYRLTVSNYANPYGNTAAPVYFHFSPAQFTLLTGAGNSKSLTWIPTIKDANLTVIGPRKSVTVSIGSGTVNLDTAFLGDQLGYRIIINRNLHPKQAYDSSFIVGTPKNLPAFGDLRILPQQSKLFIFGGALLDLARYNLQDFSKEDAISNHTNVSFLDIGYPVLFGAGADGSWSNYAMGGPIINLSPLDFSQRTLFRIQKELPNQTWVFLTANALSGPSSTGLQGVSVTYNGRKAAAVTDLNVDLEINRVMWMDSVNEDVPIVSDDGQFFCVSTRDKSNNLIYKNTGTSWSLVGKTLGGAKYFRGHGTPELIVIGAVIQVVDVSTAANGNTLQPLREFQYAGVVANQATQSIGYDSPSQHIFIETIDPYNYSTIKIFEVNNFLYKGKAVAFVQPTGSYLPRHIYSNGYHFVTSGYGEKLLP